MKLSKFGADLFVFPLSLKLSNDQVTWLKRRREGSYFSFFATTVPINPISNSDSTFAPQRITMTILSIILIVAIGSEDTEMESMKFCLRNTSKIIYRWICRHSTFGSLKKLLLYFFVIGVGCYVRCQCLLIDPDYVFILLHRVFGPACDWVSWSRPRHSKSISS